MVEPKDRKDSGKDAPDIVILPPVLDALAIAAAVGLEWLIPLPILPERFTAWSVAVGVIILAVGGGLALWGILSFLRAKTNILPTQPSLVIVETGPFRFTRNPMYIGVTGFLIALGFIFSLDWALILAPIVFGILHFGVVLREETYLAEKFGAPYVAYLERTRRWI
ncbi:MAG: isoprenylcysteine carboxylmethyltransferase family protein [Pseudomonadota bacterium]